MPPGVLPFIPIKSNPQKHLFATYVEQSQHISQYGDICFTKIESENFNLTFILGAVYIYHGTSFNNLMMFLYQALLPYLPSSQNLPFCVTDAEIPLVICGDFNLNGTTEKLIRYMHDTFNLECISPHDGATTLSGTNLDLTFVRYVNADIMHYISYFSYHRPILNRISKL